MQCYFYFLKHFFSNLMKYLSFLSLYSMNSFCVNSLSIFVLLQKTLSHSFPLAFYYYTFLLPLHLTSLIFVNRLMPSVFHSHLNPNIFQFVSYKYLKSQIIHKLLFTNFSIFQLVIHIPLRIGLSMADIYRLFPFLDLYTFQATCRTFQFLLCFVRPVLSSILTFISTAFTLLFMQI